MRRTMGGAAAAWVMAGWATLSVLSGSALAQERTPEELERQALAILQARCVACHGESKRESSLDLRTAATALRGGESGPAIVPGSARESPLHARIAAGEMPPDGQPAVTPDELAVLARWLDTGTFTANDDAARQAWTRRLDHWAFQPPREQQLPEAASPEDTSPVRDAIDAFVLERLAREGLAPAPLADKRQLIRRAYFDLIGLPPPPERVEQFVADADPQAFARLIDELLASPQYGERWGRHWLDVARYADTGGFETDVYFKNAWRYRDYVVKSFNDDKPYDCFVQEQIAGDELWPDNLELEGAYAMPPAKVRHLEALVGTGFYALGPEIHESNMDGAKLRYERLIDWVDTTAAAFLGLTFACARCHDHKFDPFTQADYFGLQAVFAGSKVIQTPIVNGMEIADQKQHYPTILAVEEARRAYRLFEQSLAGRQPTAAEERRRQELRDAISAAVLAIPERATSTPSTPFDGLLEVPTVTVLGHERTMLVPEVHVLGRGELARPKQVAPPRLPAALAQATGAAVDLQPGQETRKQLALWLTRPDHPLTARVIVNRVWGWHFGRGLVSTPNDFGHMGQPPSHPGLLDWLARDFVVGGWSIKRLHRAIMLSRTYRQSSAFATSQHLATDPDNRLLWRMNRRRLEGEAIWDALHSVAGTLNPALGGKPVMPPLVNEELTNKAAWVVNADPQQHVRRGLYVIVRRSFRFPLFDIFDAPVNAVSCAGRDCSTVAPQALWLLNNQVAQQQSCQLAARLVRESGPSDPAAWLERGWRLAVQRAPSEEERSETWRLLEAPLRDADTSLPAGELPAELAQLPPAQAAGLMDFCLALVNLNEFLFID
ncbi:MAG: PSD1 and planctomycete cytochrome C domain-containing protein [Pirellulales bacterium]|nr:PSD1 and planctomycete cytochrome C domain-containing protein [Pirellulales bacterium]